jgi:hypothetical protein
MRATESLRDGSATATASAGRRAARPSAPGLLLAGNRALARVLHDNSRHPTAACRGMAVLLRSEVDGAPVSGGLIGSVVGGIRDTVATATTVALGQIGGSVGRGGKNHPFDVAVVRELLRAAGYADPDLGAAIERYQREVAGMRRPDGRVDPGGRTLTALRGGGAPAVGPTPDSGGAGGMTTPSGTTRATPTPHSGTDPNPSPPTAGPPGPADVTRIAAEIAALATTSAGLRRSGTEEVGAGRDALVARIAQIRTMIAGLSDAGAKAGFYHQLNAVSPSYTQGTNMDLLEGPVATETRTCNITSLSMTLEGLGKSPADFTGNKEAVRAAARVYGHVVATAADHADAELESLRMPDFVQLAAIAEELGSTVIDDEAIRTAATGSQPDAQGKKIKGAWNSILDIYFLGRLARRFGVGADVVIFNLTSNDPTDSRERRRHASDDFYALRGIGSKRRSHVERMVDLRNKREELAALPASSTRRRAQLEEEIAKDAAKVDAMTDLSQTALAEDENSIPMLEYKERVRATIGAQVDRGAQVVVGLSGHYVRLQSLGDDHVMVDDPGRSARANRKVTWEEARAMGYFASALVVNG